MSSTTEPIASYEKHLTKAGDVSPHAKKVTDNVENSVDRADKSVDNAAHETSESNKPSGSVDEDVEGNEKPVEKVSRSKSLLRSLKKPETWVSQFRASPSSTASEPESTSQADANADKKKRNLVQLFKDKNSIDQITVPKKFAHVDGKDLKEILDAKKKLQQGKGADTLADFEDAETSKIEKPDHNVAKSQTDDAVAAKAIRADPNATEAFKDKPKMMNHYNELNKAATGSISRNFDDPNRIVNLGSGLEMTQQQLLDIAAQRVAPVLSNINEAVSKTKADDEVKRQLALQESAEHHESKLQKAFEKFLKKHDKNVSTFNSDADTRLKNLDKDLEAAKTSAKDFEAQTKKAIETAKSDADAREKEAASNHKDAKTTLESNHKELTATKKQALTETKSKVAETAKETKQLQKEKKDLNASNAELDTTITKLEKKLLAEKERLEALREKYSTKKQLIVVGENKESELNGVIAANEKRVSEKKADHDGIKAQVKSIGSVLSRYAEALTNLDKDKKERLVRLDAAKKEHASWEKDKQDTARKIALEHEKERNIAIQTAATAKLEAELAHKKEKEDSERKLAIEEENRKRVLAEKQRIEEEEALFKAKEEEQARKAQQQEEREKEQKAIEKAAAEKKQQEKEIEEKHKQEIADALAKQKKEQEATLAAALANQKKEQEAALASAVAKQQKEAEEAQAALIAKHKKQEEEVLAAAVAKQKKEDDEAKAVAVAKQIEAERLKAEEQAKVQEKQIQHIKEQEHKAKEKEIQKVKDQEAQAKEKEIQKVKEEEAKAKQDVLAKQEIAANKEAAQIQKEAEDRTKAAVNVHNKEAASPKETELQQRLNQERLAQKEAEAAKKENTPIVAVSPAAPVPVTKDAIVSKEAVPTLGAVGSKEISAPVSAKYISVNPAAATAAAASNDKAKANLPPQDQAKAVVSDKNAVVLPKKSLRQRIKAKLTRSKDEHDAPVAGKSKANAAVAAPAALTRETAEVSSIYEEVTDAEFHAHKDDPDYFEVSATDFNKLNVIRSKGEVPAPSTNKQ